jgi:transaldolase
MNKNDFQVKIFADGADLRGMLEMYNAGLVSGFTTNPTLMQKAGVADYEAFAHDVLEAIPDLPVSFEVFSDNFRDMEVEARIIGSWADNVYVKIPITNSKGESSGNLIRRLSADGLKLNITAMLTLEQVEKALACLTPGIGAILSIFAGRIADTGRDPVPAMRDAARLCRSVEGTECLWASTRELFNIYQAQDCGVDIITVTNDILRKLSNVGKDLLQLSLETVRMFCDDARRLQYNLLYRKYPSIAEEPELAAEILSSRGTVHNAEPMYRSN